MHVTVLQVMLATASLIGDVAAILRLPDTKERLAALGFDAVDNTPDEFAAYVKAEVIKWGKVIKDSGARVD